MSAAKIEVDSKKCCGCRICEMICSMEHFGFFQPRKALLSVELNRSPAPGTDISTIDLPLVCLHCDPAPCSDACPENAISKAAFGALVVDSEKCTGCGSCEENCRYRMIMVDTEIGIARKCDLCGGDPLCARHCPTGALTYSKGEN